ncbi:MAG TPA: translation initiation factor IF-2 [Candidatus Kapabacteria bacterium]|nr:translation initiation factor IF-2 [Candidatus Kapabacteria bacterium]
MAATPTQKTYRLFKVAAELNIGKETIAEFLNAKGFNVPVKPTSALTQEMYDLVMGKFEKEHKQIEKQRKKVDAYHEKRVRTRDDVTPQPEERKPGRKAGVEASEEEEALPAIAVEATETEMEPVVEAPEFVEPEVVETPTVEAVETESVPPAPEPVMEEITSEAPVEQLEPEIEIAEPAEPDLTPQQRADMLEEARRVRMSQLRAIAQQGRPQQEEPEEVSAEEPVAEEETAPEPAVKEETAVTENGVKFVTAPPRLQGLTVLGKIDVSKKEPDKEKGKRKRISGAVKQVDIAAEARNNRPAPAAAGTTGATGTTQASQVRTAADKLGSKKKMRSRGSKQTVSQEDVSKAIRQTLSKMEDSGGSSRQKRSRMKREMREERAQRMREEQDAQAMTLQVTEFLSVAELANLMNVDVSEVISTCIKLGLMVSINQRIDRDTIQLVADEFGYSVEFQQELEEDLLADTDDAAETLVPRAPIVTIMGHVDHGKTSLLDYVRNANVVAGEAGGITQHIGAYSVQMADGRKITFLDTPGHEAFTAMRARGAQVTDIVVLIVAADDAVMPQTVEAISHAQAANVPMVIAINKIDKPEANAERIKQQLADRGVLVEAWGGKYQCVEISAKKGLGVDKLLETILLEAEILDLKANSERNARGVVIEAELDRGKGVVATVLVQKGTLNVGDNFVAGQFAGRVRALLDERGHRIQKAGPSEPAQVLGFSGTPTAGDVMVVLDNERDVRDIATRRQQLRREQDFKQVRHITLDEISAQIAQGGIQHLPLIIKGDVDGSVEALADALLRLSTPEVQVSVIMKSVGEISESDVLLATASNAIIVGFHVRPNLKARKLAEREGVDIRFYQIIYEAVNEIRLALEGLLRPEYKEVITGTVEVREIFKISKIGIVAGCYVQDGKITRNDRIRLLRDGLEVFNGTIASLRRIKEDVREVEQGFECGITLDNMNDVREKDVIEAYKTVEVKRKLEPAGVGH